MLLYCDEISSMTDEQFDLFFDLMPTARQKKVMRYAKTDDKKLGVAAFALLCYALNLCGYKIGHYEFSTTENGKPYFKNLPLNFNISHTGNAVACAVSKTEIGVDIQKKNVEYSRVMHRICCENEIDLISASENPIDDFVKLWTLKESHVKCIGARVFDNADKYDFSSVVKSGCGKLYGYDFSVFDVGESIVGVCSSASVEQINNISLAELETFCKNKG